MPPNDHRRNIAEKALQTFKHRFVAVLCGTDVTFPMQLWCRILRQAEHQLNMLRKRRVNPMVSSFKMLCGKHDYDENPFAPLGSAIQIHVMPENQKLGKLTPKLVFILEIRGNTTGATKFGYETREVSGSDKLYFSHTYISLNQLSQNQMPSCKEQTTLCRP